MITYILFGKEASRAYYDLGIEEVQISPMEPKENDSEENWTITDGFLFAFDSDTMTIEELLFMSDGTGGFAVIEKNEYQYLQMIMKNKGIVPKT